MSVFSRISFFLRSFFKQKETLIHDGEIIAQTRFGTIHQAERLIPNYIFQNIKPDYKAFIEKQKFFFIATSDHFGRCDCSHRGVDQDMLAEGFPTVVIPDEHTLIFPDYLGNGLYQSFGNLYMNPHIGMIFIQFDTKQRVRINGTTQIVEDVIEAKRLFGEKALRMVKVNVEEVFANCPKYIHEDAGRTSS